MGTPRFDSKYLAPRGHVMGGEYVLDGAGGGGGGRGGDWGGGGAVLGGSGQGGMYLMGVWRGVLTPGCETLVSVCFNDEADYS